MSDTWVWVLTLVAALVCFLLVVPVLGIGVNGLVSRIDARLGARRAVRIAPLLPTDAPVVTYAMGHAPPLHARELRKILLVTVPLMPVFIVWICVVFLLQARWHRRIEVFVTADGTAWVTRPVSNWIRRTGSELVGSQSLQGWQPAHVKGGFVEGDLAGLRLGLLPGRGTARLAGLATEPWSAP